MKLCCGKGCVKPLKVLEDSTLSVLDKQTLLEVMNAVRKSFTKNSPHYLATVKKSLTDQVGPRGGSRYKCACCKQSFGRTEIQVDHIIPVVPIGTSPTEMTLKMLYERCWVQPSQLQVLCKTCHAKKSKEENATRRKVKEVRKLKASTK